MSDIVKTLNEAFSKIKHKSSELEDGPEELEKLTGLTLNVLNVAIIQKDFEERATQYVIEATDISGNKELVAIEPYYDSYSGDDWEYAQFFKAKAVPTVKYVKDNS